MVYAYFDICILMMTMAIMMLMKCLRVRTKGIHDVDALFEQIPRQSDFLDLFAGERSVKVNEVTELIVVTKFQVCATLYR